MVAWSQLLVPALVSAVLVFIASSLIHMVLKWHNSDSRKLSNEDEVRAAIRKGGATPGMYIVPHCKEGKDMSSPETQAKFVEGPVAVLFVRPSGQVKLGPFLGNWFVYTIVIGLLAGYIAQATLMVGTPYLKVFQVVGASAWLAYAWATPADSIWMAKPWSSTFKHMFDALIYAALTGGTFGWLWPR